MIQNKKWYKSRVVQDYFEITTKNWLRKGNDIIGNHSSKKRSKKNYFLLFKTQVPLRIASSTCQCFEWGQKTLEDINSAHDVKYNGHGEKEEEAMWPGDSEWASSCKDID